MKSQAILPNSTANMKPACEGAYVSACAATTPGRDVTASHHVERTGHQVCGAPDLILLRKEDNIPVAFVEAKDINDPDLAGHKTNKEQFDRYTIAN